MPRLTKDEERINYICESNDFDPKTVYNLSKIMLEGYRSRLSTEQIPTMVMSADEILMEKQSMRRVFLKLMRKNLEGAKDEQGIFIFKAIKAPWMWDKILYILDRVEDFRTTGPTYRLILEHAYFSKNPMSNDALPQVVRVSESAIDYRKREAIKLFGIYIWEYCFRRENEDIALGIVEKDT